MKYLKCLLLGICNNSGWEYQNVLKQLVGAPQEFQQWYLSGIYLLANTPGLDGQHICYSWCGLKVWSSREWLPSATTDYRILWTIYLLLILSGTSSLDLFWSPRKFSPEIGSSIHLFSSSKNILACLIKWLSHSLLLVVSIHSFTPTLPTTPLITFSRVRSCAAASRWHRLHVWKFIVVKSPTRSNHQKCREGGKRGGRKNSNQIWTNDSVTFQGPSLMKKDLCNGSPHFLISIVFITFSLPLSLFSHSLSLLRFKFYLM